MICHLADCEIAFGYRWRQVAAQPGHVIQTFDQDLWATQYDTLDSKQAIESFCALRQWNCTWVASLPRDAFLKPATHPERGELTLRRCLKRAPGMTCIISRSSTGSWQRAADNPERNLASCASGRPGSAGRTRLDVDEHGRHHYGRTVGPGGHRSDRRRWQCLLLPGHFRHRLAFRAGHSGIAIARGGESQRYASFARARRLRGVLDCRAFDDSVPISAADFRFVRNQCRGKRVGQAVSPGAELEHAAIVALRRVSALPARYRPRAARHVRAH